MTSNEKDCLQEKYKASRSGGVQYKQFRQEARKNSMEEFEVHRAKKQNDVVHTDRCVDQMC